MKVGLQSPARWRLCVWAVGSGLALAYYFVSASLLPRRTALGVERPICGIGQQSVVMRESPSGRQWLLTLPEAPPTAAGTTAGSPGFAARLVQDFQWPRNAVTPRQLAPFQATGTWQLRERTLHRVWDLGASGWLDEDHLWTSNDNDWPRPVALLDLRNGRTVRGRWHDIEHLYDEWLYDLEQRYDPDDWDPDLQSTLSSALEELPPDFAGDWTYGHTTVGDRGVYLVHTLEADAKPVALYAVSDEPSPRILRLARRARPLALSRDGRRLFFKRDDVLWRLDLRKPLPALLDEVRVPELPDPLVAPTSPDTAAHSRGLRGRR
jgi:hypothetical protein